MDDESQTNDRSGASEAGEETQVTRAQPAADDTEHAAVPSDAGTEVAEVDAPSAAAAPARRPSRLRGALVGVLVLLCCLSVVVTGVTLWAHYTVMDTDGYMKIVGPIGKDPQAIKKLSEYIGGEVVKTTDLQERIADALPSRVAILAGPITSYVEDFITQSAQKVLSSPKAYELWLQINRVGHEKLVALLRGDTTNVYIEGSDLRLNLLPLISRVLVWVDERLPGGLSDALSPPVIAADSTPEEGIQEIANWSGKPLSSDFGQITLLQSDALGPAQTAVQWFDRMVWILPLVTAGLIALTIWVSRRRGRTAIAIGIGAAVAIFVTRVIILRASDYLTGQLKDEGAQIMRQVVAGALGPLTSITIWTCVVGVIVAVLVWLLGRADVRAGVVTTGRRLVGQASEAQISDSPVVLWIVGRVVPLRWGVLVAGLIVLALVASSWLGIILTIVVELLLQGTLSLFAAQWPFAGKKADTPSTR